MVGNKPKKVLQAIYLITKRSVDGWRHWDKVPHSFPDNPIFKSYFGIEATRSTFNVDLIVIGTNHEFEILKADSNVNKTQTLRELKGSDLDDTCVDDLCWNLQVNGASMSWSKR